MELCETDIEYLGMRFSNAQISPSPTILNKLFDLVSVDCSKISNWRTVQGLLNQYHRFGPRFQWLVQQFRAATETQRRKILQQLSIWKFSRGICQEHGHYTQIGVLLVAFFVNAYHLRKRQCVQSGSLNLMWRYMQISMSRKSCLWCLTGKNVFFPVKQHHTDANP